MSALVSAAKEAALGRKKGDASLAAAATAAEAGGVQRTDVKVHKLHLGGGLSPVTPLCGCGIRRIAYVLTQA